MTYAEIAPMRDILVSGAVESPSATDHDGRDSAQKQPGSVVRAGWNLGPLYRIVAVDGDNAWIRELDRGLDAIARVDHLHVV
jgi:hypothetical protein